MRLHASGEVLEDNPLVYQENARPEIWTYGHQNQYGLAINPCTGDIWENKHGLCGGDEINIPHKGANYGWPIATYGINYFGLKILETRGDIVEWTDQPGWF